MGCQLPQGRESYAAPPEGGTNGTQHDDWEVRLADVLLHDDGRLAAWERQWDQDIRQLEESLKQRRATKDMVGGSRLGVQRHTLVLKQWHQAARKRTSEMQ